MNQGLKDAIEAQNWDLNPDVVDVCMLFMESIQRYRNLSLISTEEEILGYLPTYNVIKVSSQLR